MIDSANCAVNPDAASQETERDARRTETARPGVERRVGGREGRKKKKVNASRGSRPGEVNNFKQRPNGY